MSRIKCPVCGYAYDEEEAVCPNCRFPNVSFMQETRQEKEKYLAMIEEYRKNHAFTRAEVPVSDTCITFGSYRQDKDGKKQPIEWLVLERQGSRCLLLGKNILDFQQYNAHYQNVTWEDCSLRKWLNEEFLEEAFSKAEQAQIQKVTVKADRHPLHDTDPGKDTSDKLFLLSCNEAERYFSSNSERTCGITDYAAAKGAFAKSLFRWNGRDASYWWLRTPGKSAKFAADIALDGSIGKDGILVTSSYGVRPAMWVTVHL